MPGVEARNPGSIATNATSISVKIQPRKDTEGTEGTEKGQRAFLATDGHGYTRIRFQSRNIRVHPCVSVAPIFILRGDPRRVMIVRLQGARGGGGAGVFSESPPARLAKYEGNDVRNRIAHRSKTPNPHRNLRLLWSGRYFRLWYHGPFQPESLPTLPLHSSILRKTIG